LAGLDFQSSGVLPSLRLVLLARIVLLGRRHDRRVDDLLAHSEIALVFQEAIERGEQFFHRPCFRQRLTIEAQGFGVGNRILETKAEKPHEGELIAKLVFRLIVGEILERLQHQRFEDHTSSQGLRPAAFLLALAQPAVDQRRLQLRPKGLPWNQRRDGNQRVMFGVQPLIASGQIEETTPAFSAWEFC
jgi:hypothetical protein